MSEIKFLPIALDELDGDVAAVLSYWRELTGAREMPSWSEFDLLKIPLTIVKTTHVVDIEPNATDFKLRFWGTGSADIHDQELTGKYLSELQPRELGALAVEHVKKLLQVRQPIAVTTTLKSREKPEKFQVILRLPLSNTGTTVDHAVTITEFPLGRFASRDTLEKYDGASGL